MTTRWYDTNTPSTVSVRGYGYAARNITPDNTGATNGVNIPAGSTGDQLFWTDTDTPHNSADWPTAGWGYSVEVSATGADLTWTTYVERYDSAGSQVLNQLTIHAPQSGTGIKTATAVTLSTINSNGSRAATDKYGIHFGITNANMMSIQTWTVLVSDSQSWIENTNFSQGLGGSLGITTETDASQALGKRKVKATTFPSETDAAQPVTAAKGRALAVTTETETAQALGRRKVKAVGTATETDAALTITQGNITVAVGTAVETDSAVSLGKIKRKAIGAATETDSAVALGKIDPIWVAVGTAVENETAIAVGRRKAVAVTTVTESDTPQTFGKIKRRAVPTVTETDQAVSLGGVIRVAISPAIETEAALPITARRVYNLSTATESDAAVSLARVKNKALGIVTEADTAQGVTYTPASHIVVVGTAVETEAAISLGKRKVKAVGVATEASQVQAIRPAHRRVLTTVTETDSTRVLLKRKYKRVLGINVVEMAMPISVPMYSFEPPAYLVAFRQEHAWPEKRTYLGLNESFSIVRVGGVLTQVKSPNSSDLVAAGQEGRDWFLGGHIYTVPHPVAKELIAAGYSPELI